jgi:hypothetical protein
MDQDRTLILADGATLALQRASKYWKKTTGLWLIRHMSQVSEQTEFSLLSIIYDENGRVESYNSRFAMPY